MIQVGKVRHSIAAAIFQLDASQTTKTDQGQKMWCCCFSFLSLLVPVVCFCFESLLTASGRFRSIGDIWPRPLSELDCRKTALRLEWGLTPQDGDKNGCTIKHIDYTWLDEKLFLFPPIEVEPPLITGGSFSTGQIDYGKKMEEGYCVS